ncbi:MAG: helix-turn-helix domain-containing protein [Rikenellaceae bacterium]|nr:helix-turn-helix domain-containing protein [Rikenellaceae bacterium]
MNNRIQEILSAKKLTSSQFAEIMDIQPSSVSHLTSGRNKPGFDFIVKLLDRFPEINPDWLIQGKGSMYRRIQSDTNDISNNKMDSILPFFESIKKERKIDKIVVLYEDKTFDIYSGI